MLRRLRRTMGPCPFLCIATSLLFSTAQSTYVNYSCSCDYSKVWNDVIFLFDGSEATTEKGLDEMWDSARTMLGWFNVQNSSYTESEFYMRVGIVVYASSVKVAARLGEWNGDRIQQIDTLPYIDGDLGTNIRAAVVEASREFSTSAHRNTSRRVIILMGTAFDATHWVSPKQACDEFSESGGIFMVYDYEQTHGFLSPYLKSFATEGYYFNNLNNTLVDIQNALCDANCFCPPNYASFKDSPRGTPLDGCYTTSETPANFAKASSVCKTLGGVPAFDESEEKTAFLLNQLKQADHFYIGLSYNNETARWEWADGSALSQDYEPWSVGHEPNPDSGHTCTSVTPDQQWVATNCKNGYCYTCQTAPCDATRYCNYEM